MNADDYDAITTAVLSWPAVRRERLVEALRADRQREARPKLPKPSVDELVRCARGDGSPPTFPKPELDDFYGVGRGDGPPPSDEQVAEWIDDYRMRKYGGA